MKDLIYKYSYKVLVSCMTYNQSAYIQDALKGFVIQKTSFPFLCLIMDDASTDGNQDIIRSFIDRECDISAAERFDYEEADVMVAPHITNKNCTIAAYFLKKNLYNTGKKEIIIDLWRRSCEYEALCEGDDYWIDSHKLQRQITFLDNNPDYSMCFHQSKILIEMKAGMPLDFVDVEDREYSATEVFKKWIVPTASIVYRLICLKYPIADSSRVLNGDIILIEQCAHTGRIRGMSGFMSVYRIQPSGVTYNSGRSYLRVMAYPGHFECIRDSFPKIDRTAIQVNIAKRYFDRISVQKTPKAKIHDWMRSFKANESICILLTRQKIRYYSVQWIKKVFHKS